MRFRPTTSLILFAVLSTSASTLRAQGAPLPEIPVVAGLTFVLAVHNPKAAPAGSNIATGDYEMVVGVAESSADRVTLKTQIDAEDTCRVP